MVVAGLVEMVEMVVMVVLLVSMLLLCLLFSAVVLTRVREKEGLGSRVLRREIGQGFGFFGMFGDGFLVSREGRGRGGIGRGSRGVRFVQHG